MTSPVPLGLGLPTPVSGGTEPTGHPEVEVPETLANLTPYTGTHVAQTKTETFRLKNTTGGERHGERSPQKGPGKVRTDPLPCVCHKKLPLGSGGETLPYTEELVPGKAEAAA